jgi:hypothetical protein
MTGRHHDPAAEARLTAETIATTHAGIASAAQLDVLARAFDWLDIPHAPDASLVALSRWHRQRADQAEREHVERGRGYLREVRDAFLPHAAVRWASLALFTATPAEVADALGEYVAGLERPVAA